MILPPPKRFQLLGSKITPLPNLLPLNREHVFPSDPTSVLAEVIQVRVLWRLLHQRQSKTPLKHWRVRQTNQLVLRRVHRLGNNDLGLLRLQLSAGGQKGANVPCDFGVVGLFRVLLLVLLILLISKLLQCQGRRLRRGSPA